MNGRNSFNFHKRKSVQINLRKNDLNISKINQQSKLNSSITSHRKRASNVSKISNRKSNNNLFYSNNKKTSLHSQNHKHLLNSFIYKYNNSTLDNENLDSKRRSLEVFESPTHKIFQMFNFKAKDNIVKQGNIENNNNYILNKSTRLNKIEKNIKNIINNMRKEIEKKEKISHMTNTISPKIMRNKLTSSQNLKIIFKIKKNKKTKISKNKNSSLLMKETDVLDYNGSFKKKFKRKRNKSFDYSEQQKKKIFKKIKNNIFKSSSQKNLFDNKSSLSEDIDLNYNDSNYSLHPNSNFIFVFDLLLIILNLYTFIIIPLNTAKNKDIRERGTIIEEFIHFSIDLIFLLDFIISFFRGYYNYEMKIIRDNKKIIFHYLKNYLFFDFLQGLPLYTMIRIFMKPTKKLFLGYTNAESILIAFLILIKPFKIFKIIGKKQNKALEDFYLYLSENYYLEQLMIFIIYFIIFFLFVHLFICLHLFFALQNYPNWITHINIINQSFFDKYIASFYFMITTMTTVGYGDIVCISFIERIYHIILLIIGTLLYTFLVSKLGNYLRDQSYEQIKLNKDLNILENIRITYPFMSYKLYSKIKSHLLSIFNKRKKTGISLLINGVPDAIKNNLLFKIYSKVINGFKIFKDVNNSNFIIQMLTSFIPIVLKKEEIIALEGEIIQNIFFVKDGKLSLEIGIDLNNPYKSIHKYLEINFIGISRQEEYNNYNPLKRVKSVISNMPEQNYNDLKEKIDNILLDNKKTLINNSIIDNNGISLDLGRLDFSGNDKEEDSDIQFIKIIDIRKNEHFGDIHLFLEKPCPFTIKVSSRISDLFLLRKYSAMNISSNFPNIWRRIKTKSYHNLVSIKKLTFKILKQYYNTHCYNKNIKETNFAFSLDATKNFASEFSTLENGPSLPNKITINKSQNMSINKSVNKNLNKTIIKRNARKNILEKIHIKPTKTKNSINKNKLFIGYNASLRKNSAETLTDNLNFSSDSFNDLNSNSNSAPSSNFKKEEENEEKDKFPLIINKNTFLNVHKNTDIKNILNKKSNDNFTFQADHQSNKFTVQSHNKLLELTKTYKNSTLIKSSDIIKTNLTNKQLSDKTINYKSLMKNETLKYNDNNNKEFLTLEDINKGFSKKIKNKLKKRKKIQRLKELLRLQRLKINKNFLDLYKSKIEKNNNIKINSNIIQIYIKNNLNSSISSDKKMFSQIIGNSSSNESSFSIIKNKNFNSKSLKIISLESFEINSCYKNINLLTKGKIIGNINIKNDFENLIQKYSNKINEDKFKNLSSFSPRNRINKNRKISFIINENQKKQTNRNEPITEDKNSISAKSKNKFISEEKFTFNKYYKSKKSELSTQKSPNNLVQNNKMSTKFLEKELEKIEALNEFQKNKIEFSNQGKINIKNEINIYNGNIIKTKGYFETENSDKKINENQDKINDDDNNINERGLTNSINAFNDYDKDNKIAFLNIKNPNSSKKIQTNNLEEKGSNKNCCIF